MLDEVNAYLNHLDKKLADNIKMYGMAPDSFGEMLLSTRFIPQKNDSREEAACAEQAGKKASILRKTKKWMPNFVTRHAKEKEKINQDQVTASTSEQHVDNHFRDIALELLRDKALYEQGRELRAQLMKWNVPFSNTEDRWDLDTIASRFKLFQQWELYDSGTDESESAWREWANYMLKKAQDEYKESRKCLDANVLNLVPLGPIAELLENHLQVKSFTHGWEWYRSNTGAPQIGGDPAHCAA